MSAEVYDAIIIGGGPAGLSAAIYTSRERMKTLVLEKATFGGMAAITETIDNYPGFSKGISGRELAEEMKAQAERFGATCTNFVEVSGITASSDGLMLDSNEGTYRAKTVLVTTGSTYREMGVPGEAELIGRGVHFCATCDAPLYKDLDVVVVGGGNSAMQESLFIARFARSVTLLVRGTELTGSEILKEQIASTAHLQVRYNISTQSLAKPEPRGKITVSVIGNNGQPEDILADGVFVFIGLLPNAHGFESLGVDERGFINSNAQFQTHIPGVFVAGDIRSGSTWQIACSVGEGVAAALSMRGFLDTNEPNWHLKTINEG